MLSKATNRHTTDRRRFLAFTAGASALAAGSLGVAAMPAASACDCLMCLAEGENSPHRLRAAQCFLADDSELVRLEQEILEQRRLAQVHDDEVMRLSEVWQAELSRLENDGTPPRSAWDAVRSMPESAEHDRLVKLQQPHWEAHDAAVERMFSIPATTPEGRAAKASALLALMADFMMSDPDEGDYPLDFVRKLLVELGGKPGQVRSWM